MTRYDIAALKRRLGAIKTEDNPALVKQKSRDFFWYSPVLRSASSTTSSADIVVTPARTAEVVETLAAAHALGIPVTPRGSGTGNYGQAMPLAGGIVLNLAEMNAVKTHRARAGRLRAGRHHGRRSTGPRARSPARNCGCIPRPTRPPRSAASSPAARAASARSTGAACATSATC